MPPKTQRDSLKALPAETTDVILQLNSMAMSGGIYLYDKVKSTLLETGYPSFSVSSASWE